MAPPEIDVNGQPFSYFAHPTDVLGAPYAPLASEVTPEGYVYTGFGELMFFTGNPPRPVDVRIKTLRSDYLPIVEYTAQRDGVRYDFTLVAIDRGGELAGAPLNFISVRVTNEARAPRAAFLGSAWRFSAPPTRLDSRLPAYRFRQRMDQVPKRLLEGQDPFNPNWRYELKDGALLRDGRIVYLYPTDPAPDQTSLSLTDNGLRTIRFFSGELGGNTNPKLTSTPETPMGLVLYRIALRPGESRQLTFKLPLVPAPEGGEGARLIRQASVDDALQATVNYWEKLVGKASPFSIPETKPQSALLANTIFNLLAIDKVGSDFIVNVNKFQYHRYFPGNCADMLVALDLFGLHDIAARCYAYTLKMQSPDGGIRVPHHPVSQSIETWGYVLWAWNRHYQLTGDRDFLARVYPGVRKGFEWERNVAAGDPLGVMPRSTAADDAFLKDTRQTGESLWTLIGLRNAIAMATAMGAAADEAAYRAEYDRYRAAFEKLLAAQTAKSGGWIPAALERTLLGNHWDNLLTLYPEPLFAPFDARVTATIRHSRADYREGIATFVWPRAVARTRDGDQFDERKLLHYWQSSNNAQNALVRGAPEDQEAAVRDLYALLLHTTSTHAPQEFSTVPWGDRDNGGGANILPDGASSAKIISLLRNMLVREDGEDLMLLSAISPEWARPGKTLVLRDAPTHFGPISATFAAAPGGWTLELRERFRRRPRHLLVRVPWFLRLNAAEADGKPVAIRDGQIVAPAGARRLRLLGAPRPEAPSLSFERAVADYQQEYRERYLRFLETGKLEDQ
jgi:hypothetical protein